MSSTCQQRNAGVANLGNTFGHPQRIVAKSLPQWEHLLLLKLLPLRETKLYFLKGTVKRASSLTKLQLRRFSPDFGG